MPGVGRPPDLDATSGRRRELWVVDGSTDGMVEMQCTSDIALAGK
jgi:hypothetical protein